ncbi:collagen alpha-1(XXV) chain-like [Haliotis rufescens]|uniref:collagen alpha-1(XXV) chain-like n=1 Tax=Haliotis rufescens TaxID=6454 RepID=UPI00201F13EA|nr:collagen alpha-1(XXV) chain-like [Haliotis rufescens]
MYRILGTLAVVLSLELLGFSVGQELQEWPGELFRPQDQCNRGCTCADLKGVRGITGAKGEPGENGMRGYPGVEGPGGLKGQKGERGFLGTEGEKGDMVRSGRLISHRGIHLQHIDCAQPRLT